MRDRLRHFAALSALLGLLGILALGSGCSLVYSPTPRTASGPVSVAPTATPSPSQVTSEPFPPDTPSDTSDTVSVEATPGLSAAVQEFPWPSDADALRARWSRFEFKHADTKTRIVALTFDDGPRSGLMIRATDVLDHAGAKATFFCVGSRVMLNQAETIYAFRHGMEIENHTWSHHELNRSAREDLSQILSTDSIIGEVTGVRPIWVRPRSGVADAVGLSAVRDTGHLLAGWDVHAGDTGTWNEQQITAHVLASVQPGDIVDLHVTNPITIKALPGILAGLKARGFRMVTLSELAVAKP